MEPDKVEVVYGNYDLYESLRATREAEIAAERKAATKTESIANLPTDSVRVTTKTAKRKRKFPYRKTAELEADVLAQEELVAELEARLANPDIYRDAHLVKETMQDFEDAKERLQTLYEHWEEALELNG
jgi:ATP-binding cassette subfamily F protein 3